MKPLRIKLSVLAIACFLVGLVGCNVQETTPSLPVPVGVNQDLVKEVASIAESQVQKIAFTQMLSNEERIFLFKKRIVDKMQLLTLTTEQKDHLNLLLANMSSKFYTKTVEGQKGIAFLSAWTEKGKVLFDQGILYDIVGSLAPSSGGVATNLTAPPPTVKCGCATTSNYCGDTYNCNYIPSCNAPGCGTLWSFTCNGSCDRAF